MHPTEITVRNASTSTGCTGMPERKKSRLAKKEETSTAKSGDCLILSHLKDDLMVDIFQFLGAEGTSQCSMVCQQWYQIAKDSRCLWQLFTKNDFALSLESQDKGTSAISSVDWRHVYGYLATTKRGILQEQKQLSTFAAMTVLSPRVLFSDDGSPVPGYPPEHAVKPQKGPGGGAPYTKAWCTNSGVDHDVDLVLELPTPSLITGFEVANGGFFYSAPLHQALVFASYTPIDLEQARYFNGKQGSQCVQQMTSSNDNNNDNEDNPNNNKKNKILQPLAAFCLPPPPQGFSARSRKQLAPQNMVVARYIHFKLLNSHKSPDGRLADNIDVKDLLTLGTELPQLDTLLKQSSSSAQKVDPSYKRLHAIRAYNPPHPNDWW